MEVAVLVVVADTRVSVDGEDLKKALLNIVGRWGICVGELMRMADILDVGRYLKGTIEGTRGLRRRILCAQLLVGKGELTITRGARDDEIGNVPTMRP